MKAEQTFLARLHAANQAAAATPPPAESAESQAARLERHGHHSAAAEVRRGADLRAYQEQHKLTTASASTTGTPVAYVFRGITPTPPRAA